MYEDEINKVFFFNPEVKAYVLDLIKRSSLKTCNLLIQGYIFAGIKSKDLNEALIDRYLQSDYTRMEDIWAIPMSAFAIYKLYFKDDKNANSHRLSLYIRLIMNLYPKLKQYWDFQNRLQVDAMFFNSNLLKVEASSDFFTDLVKDYPPLIARTDPRNIVFVCRTIYSLPKSLISEDLLASFVKIGANYISTEYLDKQKDTPKSKAGGMLNFYEWSTISYILQVLSALDSIDKLGPDLLTRLLKDMKKNHEESIAIKLEPSTLSRLTYFLTYLRYIGPQDIYNKHKTYINKFILEAESQVAVTAAGFIQKEPVYLENAPGEPTFTVGEYLNEIFGVQPEKESLVGFMFADFSIKISIFKFAQVFGENQLTDKDKLSSMLRLAIEIHGPYHFFPNGELNIRSLLKAKLLNSMGYRYTFMTKSFIWAAHGSTDRTQIRKAVIEELSRNLDYEATVYRKYPNLHQSPSK